MDFLANGSARRCVSPAAARRAFSWLDGHRNSSPALLDAVAQFGISGIEDAQSPAQRRVVLISDLQEGAKLDGLQGREWPSRPSRRRGTN